MNEDDLRITDDRYGATLALSRCRDCDFVFAADDDLRELTTLYEGLSDPGYVQDQLPRVLQMRALFARVLAARPHARSLLDVGAGAGLLVAEAQRSGLDALGVEPSRSLVEHARRVNGVVLLQGVLPHADLAGRRFDLVSLVDVLEHVTDPVGVLRDCAGLLAPDGILLVVTPDVRSPVARVMAGRWWHYRLAHIGYFSSRSLARAAANAALIETDAFRPHWYFRVRYLAERLARYVPMQALNRQAARRRLLRRLYDRVIRFAPHDSMGVLFRPTQAGR